MASKEYAPVVAGIRVGTFLAPKMLGVYQAITDALGDALETTCELVVEPDYQSCLDDLNDICFVCSLPYVHFERLGFAPAIPVAAPVLRGARYQSRPIYFSDVIVRADSGIETFADLRGRSWAYNEPLSQSGYGITRYHLVTLGETKGYFGEVIEAGFHEASIRMVAEGSVDASAIDSQILAMELRDDSRLAGVLHVIDSLGPSTIQPVGVSRRFDDGFREKVRQVLLGLAAQEGFRPILDAGMIDHFAPVTPEDFDDIRAMLDACERAGFMEIR